MQNICAFAKCQGRYILISSDLCAGVCAHCSADMEVYAYSLKMRSGAK